MLATVTDYTRFYGLPAPAHPLLTLIDLGRPASRPVARCLPPLADPVVPQLYTVFLKRNLNGPLLLRTPDVRLPRGRAGLFGPRPGAFRADASPGQLRGVTGWMLVFHPDLLRKYPLGQKITSYGFFSYAVHEALHLSAQGRSDARQPAARVSEREYERPIDAFSQDVLIAQLEVLLSYANRFYHRQFLTRRTAEHDLLSRFEALLTRLLRGQEAAAAAAHRAALSPTHCTYRRPT
ncbi:MAG: hypothetical protein WKG07_22110 [Hymenobacter sp.]